MGVSFFFWPVLLIKMKTILFLKTKHEEKPTLSSHTKSYQAEVFDYRYTRVVPGLTLKDRVLSLKKFVASQNLIEIILFFSILYVSFVVLVGFFYFGDTFKFERCPRKKKYPDIKKCDRKYQQKRTKNCTLKCEVAQVGVKNMLIKKKRDKIKKYKSSRFLS